MDTASAAGVFSAICPTRQILDRIADKWTTLVIGILSEAHVPVRFSEIRRQIGGISQKMLTQTLRELERDGLVIRNAYPVIPPRVEYSLTALGHTLESPLKALAIWAEQHMGEVQHAQGVYDCRDRQKSGWPAA